MLVSDLLAHAAQAYPDKPAVWFNGEWKTYGQLDQQANQMAAYLIRLGVQPGDRVAILLSNSFDFITSHFGALKAGAVEVALNTELDAGSLKQLLLDCEARVLITSNRFAKQWRGFLGELPDLHDLILDQLPSMPANQTVAAHSLAAIYQAPPAPPVRVRRIDLDLASLIYTSGSTGQPKGVMLSHLNLVSNMRSIAAYLALRSEDRMMVVLPFYYVYGRSLLYSHFLSGGSLVIDNRFAFPTTVLNSMEEHEVTGFAGVPSTFSILLKQTDLKKRRFPELRFITQAGGGMAPTLQKELVAVFPKVQLYIMYGSTEASPRLTYVEPEMLPNKWGSIGRAIPNVEVAILDEAGRRLPAGVPGQIAARGSNIMIGYWKAPEATAEVLRHGYYYTGDLGYEDQDGYIFLTGRSRDIIKVGGNRVSAKEIEDVILEIREVLEVAVIGVPDEVLGEAIKAFVVRHQLELTEEAIKNHLGRQLPSFKLPKWIQFVESLPKNQSGKILKSVLREQARQPANGLATSLSTP